MKNFAIAGNLGSTPELKTKGDTSYVNLRIAANGKKTDWFWVTCFGPLAEAAAKMLQTGDVIAVSGHLRTSTYNDKERVELIAASADFFPKKRD